MSPGGRLRRPKLRGLPPVIDFARELGGGQHGPAVRTRPHFVCNALPTTVLGDFFLALQWARESFAMLRGDGQRMVGN